MSTGDSATLECTVTGSPELTVKWFKDGKEVISGRKYKMSVKENTAVLKILSADKGDSSEYRMQVSNKVGRDECSSSVTVLGQCANHIELDSEEIETGNHFLIYVHRSSRPPVLHQGSEEGGRQCWY